MSTIRIIQKLSLKIDNGINYITFLAIICMIISITMQIVFRMFFNALSWSEEAARYLLVWSTFLGSTMAYKRGMHIAVTFIIESFPPAVEKTLQIISHLLAAVFFVIIIVYGIRYMQMQSTQVSASLRIPMKYVYFIIPFSAAVMGIHAVTKILEVLFPLKSDQENQV
ncbi:MAG: hypothetical protein B6241_12335 [Spirochaetaceae bacterium 4572_59]|nr:MAG: hypothetical protein B6241_12335 [Spirochaetaceae bacterium 4572_59]